MDGDTSVIKGTAKQILQELMRLPDDAVVRLMIGRPSLSAIAHKLQDEAREKGMTETIHNDLLNSLKDDH